MSGSIQPRRRPRPFDRNRFVWPPARSDAGAAASLVVMVTLFAIGHPIWALGALVLVVVCLLWPSSKQVSASLSPQDGLRVDAQREVDAPGGFVVVEPKPERPES